MGDFLSYELLPIVFNMSVTASVAIFFVLLARLLLKRAPKIFSYALWAVVLFRLLCPVSITTGFSLLGLFDAPVTEATAHTSVVEYVPQDVVHTRDLEVQLPMPAVSQAVNEALPQEHAALGADPLEGPMALALMVWIAGICVMAVYSLVSLLRLRRRLVGAVPLRDNICLADHIASPFVMGVFRPKIYLPSALSEQEQTYILLHEQHHIRRGDHIVKVLAFIALCIHWFNPLVWVAFVLSSKDMEMSCDEAVVKKLGEGIRADYSASLLSLATGRRIIAGTPLAFGEGDTKSRIRNLLNWKKPKVWITILAAVICVAVVAACAGNPQGTQRETVDTTGQYTSMEDYAQRTMDGKKTANYYSADGSEATANVTGTKLAWLEKQGEVDGLAPEGTLEAWTFHYLVQVDAEPEQIMLVGGMYEEDGWYDLEGQGGHNLVALRYADGSYDILYNAVVNDNLDFYGYHNNYEEAIYDWYVTENGLNLPLYVKELTGDGVGNIPAHRYDGDGWYLYIPVSGWKQIEVRSNHEGRIWGWGSAYDTGADLIVAYFSSEEAPSLRGNSSYMKPLDSENRVWEQQGDDYVRNYFTDTPDGGCWRVSVRLPFGSVRAPGELETLYAMAESFTVDSRFQGSSEPLLTLDDVLALSEKGEALTWADFEPYSYIERGNGDNLYIRIYPISGTELAVSIGGGLLTDPPGHINLADSDEYIDIRTGDVAAFIRSHQAGESSAEPLSAEEVAWFNDWFEPIVQDKQGNDIGVNPRCCFLTSYYDDVTELNFEEFMRYFPGDGSRTSEADFEALREVDGWPFDWVESLEKMPVPVHKYPKRLVDLILGEYAGISTEDLDTSAVAYLPEYDAYYNYTSDFGPGMFVCTRGERDGDIIRLYSVNGTALLTLRQVNDKTYQIVSLQLLESAPG